MIQVAELKRIAAKNNIALSVVEKDYALTWILFALSKTKYRKILIFKGGTSLRKIYFPDWRYSEDLDFTSSKLSEQELNEMIKEIKKYLITKVGLNITLKSFHLNPAYCQLRLQFNGPLNYENTIKMDLSFDELVSLQPEERLILSEYSDNEKNLLQTYPLEEILAEKIRSILQRAKTRDYYDTWKILKFHAHLLDKATLKTVLTKKCKFKNIIYDKESLFDKKKIVEAAKHWDKGLAHQIDDLPEFSTVVKECKKLLDTIL